MYSFKNCYSVDHELSPFIGLHLILVWNEVKISRLKRDSFAGSPPRTSVGVCWGDPNKSAFEGSQGWAQHTGKQTRAGFLCCQRICMSELGLSFPYCEAFYHVIHRLLGPGACRTGLQTANCNHNVLKPVWRCTQTRKKTLLHFSASFLTQYATINEF